MISFKGILKYSIYLFIAGWMFALGIMVGRGSSPIEFDTQAFQKRLETIAGEFGKKEIRKKIDLKFYDVLDRPVAKEGLSSKEKPLEIIPKKEPAGILDRIPNKTSRKKQTFKQVLKKQISAKHISGKPAAEKPAVDKPKGEQKSRKGKYTIQIAAYKEFKDAVSQMVSLEKKGFSSYRIKGKKDGQTWYRIRTGSFANLGAAKKFKEKLKKAGIRSIILKKETNEDIKG